MDQKNELESFCAALTFTVFCLSLLFNVNTEHVVAIATPPTRSCHPTIRSAVQDDPKTTLGRTWRDQSETKTWRDNSPLKQPYTPNYQN
jgi:hypothetical protein